MTVSKNIFAQIPETLPEELFEVIAGNQDVKIERIVGQGHKSTDEFWYEQQQHEFVILLKGQAKLQFADNGNETIEHEIDLNTGDYLTIVAGCKHRVSWTSPETECIWLAVHYS